MARKKRKRSSLLLRIITVAAVVAFSIQIVENYSQIGVKTRELEILKNKYSEQQEVRRDIQRTLDMSDSRDYIEKVARDRLGFVYPDEKIFIDISGK